MGGCCVGEVLCVWGGGRGREGGGGGRGVEVLERGKEGGWGGGRECERCVRERKKEEMLGGGIVGAK